MGAVKAYYQELYGIHFMDCDCGPDDFATGSSGNKTEPEEPVTVKERKPLPAKLPASLKGVPRKTKKRKRRGLPSPGLCTQYNNSLRVERIRYKNGHSRVRKSRS